MTIIGALSRCGTAIVASALLAGCVSTVPGSAVRAHNVAPGDVALLTAARLDDVLLPIGEINAIMGATHMTVSSLLQQMTDHSAKVSDPHCLAAIYGAEQPVYAHSSWTAMRDQVSREPGQENEHWVEQTAVLYPSAQHAQKFFDDSKSSWQKCSGYLVSVDDGENTYLWQIATATAQDALLTQLTAQKGANGWACQHALSLVSNLTVEAWACSYGVKDEAVTIANEMVAAAAKK